jgi:hypothetical protein
MHKVFLFHQESISADQFPRRTHCYQSSQLAMQIRRLLIAAIMLFVTTNRGFALGGGV